MDRVYKNKPIAKYCSKNREHVKSCEEKRESIVRMTGDLSLTIQAGSQFSDIFKVMREDGIFCPTKLLF